MKMKRYFSFLLVTAVLSCTSTKDEPALEALPYFDLKGFIDVEINKLESDSVLKTSEINGEEQIVDLQYSAAQWKEEFAAFYEADINVPSLASSYSTRTTPDQLIHELLPEAKGKVKEITIRYVQNYPVWITFRLRDENMFYQSSTLGEIFLNQSTRKIDHYKIETTQKVLFLSPTHIKISGVIH
jgi:hypothetical protein